MNPKRMTKEQLVNALTELQEAFDAQSTLNSNLNKEKKELNELVSERDKAIENLKKCLEENQEFLRKKDNQLTSVSEERDSYKADVVEKTKEIQNLRTQITNVRNDAQGMESRINELTVNNSKLRVWKYVAVGAITCFLIALCIICA